MPNIMAFISIYHTHDSNSRHLCQLFESKPVQQIRKQLSEFLDVRLETAKTKTSRLVKAGEKAYSITLRSENIYPLVSSF